MFCPPVRGDVSSHIECEPFPLHRLSSYFAPAQGVEVFCELERRITKFCNEYKPVSG